LEALDERQLEKRNVLLSEYSQWRTDSSHAFWWFQAEEFRKDRSGNHDGSGCGLAGVAYGDDGEEVFACLLMPKDKKTAKS
jgi:hypothetical protein